MSRLVVITGLSGSGKTLAANCFEDLGYFCVDNLPVGLIAPFRELIQRGADPIRTAALVIDAREGAFLEQFPETLRTLREQNVPFELLYFDCSDDVLKRRFSETRRPHPMAREGQPLDQAIHDERTALRVLRDVADRIIDTSNFTAHQLRSFIKNSYGVKDRGDAPNVNVVSFGFKYGVPTEADLVFDVRFLPNPYFVEGLREKDGRDEPIRAFLDKSPLTSDFQKRLEEFVDFLIPLYGAEGKSYLTVAIGCTGGRHRSVALAERLGRHLSEQNFPTTVSHRDVGRD